MGGNVVHLVDRLSTNPGNRKSQLSGLGNHFLGVSTIVIGKRNSIIGSLQSDEPLTFDSLGQKGMTLILPREVDLIKTAANYSDNVGNNYFSVEGAIGYFVQIGKISGTPISLDGCIYLTLFKIKGTPDLPDIYRNLTDTLRKKITPTISHDPAAGGAMNDRFIERENLLRAIALDLLKTGTEL